MMVIVVGEDRHQHGDGHRQTGQVASAAAMAIVDARDVVRNADRHRDGATAPAR